MLHTIRIPEEHWGKVWRALVATGPAFRETVDPIYVIDDKQLRMLRRRKSWRTRSTNCTFPTILGTERYSSFFISYVGH